MAGRLEGKVAVISGSTSGIGRASAVLFAKEGARVVVNGRREELGEQVVEEIRAAGGTATFYHADISQKGVTQALVAHAVGT
jgi:NAD(P)-dependent dehydrogenase (short-subunit alcohol dehydrogenase family)